MRELSIKEEKEYMGGAGISAALINAFSKGFTTFTDIGRYLGSSIRRIFDKNFCDY